MAIARRAYRHESCPDVADRAESARARWRMSAAQLIVYLLVALVVGLLAERLVGASLPGGFLGAILAALLGMWLMVSVLRFAVPGDIDLAGVPMITAILG